MKQHPVVGIGHDRPPAWNQQWTGSNELADVGEVAHTPCLPDERYPDQSDEDVSLAIYPGGDGLGQRGEQLVGVEIQRQPQWVIHGGILGPRRCNNELAPAGGVFECLALRR